MTTDNMGNVPEVEESVELKECPFCGGKARWNGAGCMECISCEARGPMVGSNLRDHWNTRTPQAHSWERYARALLKIAGRGWIDECAADETGMHCVKRIAKAALSTTPQPTPDTTEKERE